MRMGIETKKVFLRAAKNSKTERSIKGTTTIDSLNMAAVHQRGRVVDRVA